MLCAIMQPTYLPWMGYFDLIDQVDIFVFLDDAKVSKQSWGVRNRIVTSSGEMFLTVPLRDYRDHTERTFINTELDNRNNWTDKHLKTLQQSYSKALHFNSVYTDLSDSLRRNYSTIGQLNMAIIRMIAHRIGITTKLVCSSEIPDTLGSKDDRLVLICRAVGADSYLSPQGSAAYIEKDRPGGAFPAGGVGLYYHNFSHPEYPHQRDHFISHMSVIDMLMNCGYKAALEIIRSGRREMIPYSVFRESLSNRPDFAPS